MYQFNEVLQDQLVNACSGVPECTLCLYDPADTLEGVCNQLRSAVSTAMTMNKDRQRDNQYGNNRGNRGRIRGLIADRPFNRSPSDRCWSTKHSMDKRRQAYDRFKSNKYVQDASSTGYSNFLTEYEGFKSLDDNDGDKDIRQYLQMIPASTNNDDEGANDSDAFFVSTAFFNKSNFSGKALFWLTNLSSIN
ncbi:LOW QUALITY PROTEIN: hypothetical protein ColTof4_01120 [Colletotrichum tofieldiae]|nr:LOW QUALITY PROTEIN: hypothetical protein ColTof3_08344 [Colletotrichum tofieldiae]GKT68697.1 LOW QUALITY PROTEIN: hypothetical protein ColTof4_01120 [Colletotrichum tofieldiae]